jgi:hypothetical protein
MRYANIRSRNLIGMPLSGHGPLPFEETASALRIVAFAQSMS